MQTISHRGVPCRVTFKLPGALRDQGHSQLATSLLLGSPEDVLLLVDGDVAFEPDDVALLCQQTRTHDVVCGLAGPGLDRCWVTPEAAWEPRPTDDPTPIQVRWSGAGLLAIRREVIESLGRRADLPTCDRDLKPFFSPLLGQVGGSGTYIGDSQAFCERVWQGGFPVHLNPAVRAERIGSGPVDVLMPALVGGAA
jgi:hypothetical protein